MEELYSFHGRSINQAILYTVNVYKDHVIITYNNPQKSSKIRYLRAFRQIVGDNCMLLLNVKPSRYVWIGCDYIRAFETQHEICEFVVEAPYGVHLAYAIDIKGNYYLLNTQIIITARENIKNPYEYYRLNARICGDDNYESRYDNSILLGFDHIMAFYVGNCKWILNHYTNCTIPLYYDITLVKSTGMSVPVTHDQLNEIIAAAGEYAGFVTFNWL